MKVRTSVLRKPGSDVEVVEADLAPPKAGEVLVRVSASGVCHTDYAVARSLLPMPVPIVLGHEGAGVVEAVGEGVTRCQPGDHVVMSIPQCGKCLWCQKGQHELCTQGAQASMGAVLDDSTTRFEVDGEPLYQMCGLGTFAEATVVRETSITKISPDVSLSVAALLGCSVLTGVGAALNTGKVSSDDTVVVIGCGGVGLNVIQGCRIGGARRIVAVDRIRSKLGTAQAFGATDTVLADKDPVDEVIGLTDQIGADIVFDVVGSSSSAAQGLRMTRRGGQLCVIGMADATATLDISLIGELLFAEKCLRGSTYGSSEVSEDIPQLLYLYGTNELKLDELISQYISLSGINMAFDDMERGEHTRSLITFT